MEQRITSRHWLLNLASQTGLPVPDALKLLPERIARQWGLLPLRMAPVPHGCNG
jgi:hypothetical protein